MVSGEKRNNDGENFMENFKAILLDIEGTTTSVSFVKDTLFPYVQEHLVSYVDSHWEDSEFKEVVAALKEQAKEDDKIDGFCPIEEGEKEKESIVKNVQWQMSLDRKTTALKQLQGHIWREGYKNGKLKGHLYDDVVPVLKKWQEENRKIYIFSSGSVEAQKLLFEHSNEGNILEYISGHFDTTVGSKTETASYENIIKSVECAKDQILFLTDVVKEAEAARAAGMEAVIVIRENNEPVTDDATKNYMTISSFQDLVCESAAKRKKVCEDAEKVEKTAEKEEAAPENENNHVNGTEKMDVDVTNEKPEAEEEKTANNKTEEMENDKTESEDVEIDVVNEAKKDEEAEEENVDVCANGDGEQQAAEEAETSADKEDAKEDGNSEPQVDVEPAPIAEDPLDITSEQKDEPVEQNGTAAEEEKNEKIETNGDAEATDEAKPDGDAVSKVEGKEVNGDVNHAEEKVNSAAEDGVVVAKAVAEDVPESAVEVKA